jgi:hypothetical protein
MADPNANRDIETLLSRLGDEMAAGDSIAPEVQMRLARASMQPPRTRFALAAAACVLLIGTGFWLGRGSAGRQGTPGAEIVTYTPAVRAAWAVGDTVVVQHVASMVDGRGVLVVWSCRNGELVTQPGGDENQPAKYTQLVLARESMADGRTMVWSLFLPVGDVKPAADPPSIRVRTSDGRLLALSAPPAVESREKLSDSLQDASLPGRPRVSLEDIEWVLQGT